jgi:rhodanese-related sulfurtransferase
MVVNGSAQTLKEQSILIHHGRSEILESMWASFASHLRARQCERRRKQIMTIQLIKLLLIYSLTALICGDVNGAEPNNDPLATVQENVATHKAVLVDVREPGEWKEGHVEGAILLPLSSLTKDVDTSTLEHQLPKDKIVYTHCVMGVRARKAAKILEKLGYNVRPLNAGYEDLVKAGFQKATN